MGYTTTSAERTQAKSVVSSSVATFNNPDGTGFGISSTSASASTITQYSVVEGTPSGTGTSLSGGSTVTISSLQVMSNGSFIDALDDTAIDATGGFIRLTGVGFTQNANVYFGSTLLSNVTITSTQIDAQIPATSVGTYQIYFFNQDGSGAIWPNNLTVSGPPAFTTTSYTSISQTLGLQLLATGDAPLTYYIKSGSANPQNLAVSNTGYVTGTVPDAGNYTLTVIVDDAQLQSTQTDVTIAVLNPDPYFNRTVLLLSADGENNSNNNTIIDSSNNNFTITRSGDVAQGTFSPFNSGGWSGYFDGTGDYLNLADNAAFSYGTENFTVELWFYPTSFTGNQIIVDQREATPAGGGYSIEFNGSSTIQLATGTVYMSSSVPAVLNSWNHVCYVRSESTLSLYINGVRGGTATNSVNLTSQRLTIGAYTGRASAYFNGYISNIRLVKGTAVYDPTQTTITVPTSPLTAISNTSLLTCQSNRFVDNSTNAFTISRSGDASVQPFIPFAPGAQYSTTTVGGSVYFDGTGDFLSIPAASVLWTAANSFTMEMWAKLDSIATNKTLFGKDAGTSGTGIRGFAITVLSTGAIQIFYSTTGTSETNISSATGIVGINVWNHIAFVKNGSACNLYLNGTSVISFTSATIACPVSQIAYIGASQGSTNLVIGHISNFRIVNGTAVYTSAFTSPTQPLTNIANTSLLLNFTNAGVIDGTAKNVIETNGTATINTAISKFGSSSLFFDGVDDSCLMPYSPNFNLGTGEFTIECWVNFSALTSNRLIFDTYTAASAGGGYQLFWRSTGSSIAFYGNGVVIAQSSFTSHAVGTWYHVAVTRDSSGIVRIYIDGTRYAYASYTTALDIATTARPAVGIQYTTLTNDFSGYIDDLRVTKGYARYTANTSFTVPVATHPPL